MYMGSPVTPRLLTFAALLACMASSVICERQGVSLVAQRASWHSRLTLHIL